MADYFTPTVIQQSIPTSDMTPLERLLLSRIFSAEPHGDGVYFYTDEGPADIIVVTRASLETALAESKPAGESTATRYVAEHLAHITTAETEIDLDFSGTSWEFLFQDIVRRSATLRYVTAISSFICSKMRPDGFGGMAVLITADRIVGKSTSDLIEDFLTDAGLDE